MDKFDETIRAKISEVILMEDEELYAEIGKRLTPAGVCYISAPHPKSFQIKGQKFFFGMQTRLQEIICTSTTIKSLAQKGFSTELVAAVLGLIESLAIGTAATPVAALICKRGLNQLCNKVWDCERQL